ncbi:MAG: superoxide dismutase family protein [Clostridia bacterium]|nr:superoxide dismutase family protein [Clostridia bacterium]
MRELNLMSTWCARPAARALIAGSPSYPDLHGSMDFYEAGEGTVVMASLWGLPYNPAPCAANICAMHIHAGGACKGTQEEPFADALGHYNPGNCPHPGHAGDLPPLFSNRGYAWLGVYTERVRIPEIIGHTVIIHEWRDDFTSQPAGDAGARIGCGLIESLR